MMLNLTSTKEAAHLHGIKILVYGQSGVGKTRLCATAPSPVIISAEAGLLSLKDYDIPVITVNTVEDLFGAYNYLTSDKGVDFETICLDSISEIGETILANAKKISKDPRQAYGTLIEDATEAIKRFRDLQGKNVYFSCKQETATDPISGQLRYAPSMPGSKLAAQLPYLFDGVFHLDIGVDEEGETFRYLRTASDMQHIAKDRSGALDEIETPDLGTIFNKILSSIDQK